jgi:O-6-methylguanine DNA methyltransferase
MNTTTITPTAADVPATSAAPALSQSGPVVGVRTTRIYCRPICRPSVAPKPENCTPFLSAEAAEAAGYRPCKLCRPEEGGAGKTRDGVAKPRPKHIRYAIGPTPIGYAFLALSERGLCVLYFLDEADPAPGLARLRADFPRAELVEDAAAVAPMLERVWAYLEGGDAGDDLPLDLHGTPFQQRVWGALRTIPRGATLTYGAIAKQLGLPMGAARAVGTAIGANPVAVLVPCHRVVRSNGALGGFRWGLDRKRALLERECQPTQRTLVV